MIKAGGAVKTPKFSTQNKTINQRGAGKNKTKKKKKTGELSSKGLKT